MSRKTETTQYKKKRDQLRKTNKTQKKKDRRQYEDRPTYDRFFKYSTEPKRKTDKRYKKITDKRFYR